MLIIPVHDLYKSQGLWQLKSHAPLQKLLARIKSSTGIYYYCIYSGSTPAEVTYKIFNFKLIFAISRLHKSIVGKFCVENHGSLSSAGMFTPPHQRQSLVQLDSRLEFNSLD